MTGVDIGASWCERSRFIGTDLTDAHLGKCKLDDADLTGAIMVRIKARQAEFYDARLVGVRCEGG